MLGHMPKAGISNCLLCISTRRSERQLKHKCPETTLNGSLRQAYWFLSVPGFNEWHRSSFPHHLCRLHSFGYKTTFLPLRYPFLLSTLLRSPPLSFSNKHAFPAPGHCWRCFFRPKGFTSPSNYPARSRLFSQIWQAQTEWRVCGSCTLP